MKHNEDFKEELRLPLPHYFTGHRQCDTFYTTRLSAQIVNVILSTLLASVPRDPV